MPNGAKHWCVTLNNYTDGDVAKWRDIGGEDGTVYFVFGKEVGASGTSHLQAYVSFSSRKSLSALKSKLGCRIHAEVMRGTPAQAADYCKKDGNFEEFGTVPKGRGQRNDIVSVMAKVRAGATRRQLMEECPAVYARAFKMLNEAILLYGLPRSWQPVVNVYYGETGIGKTRRAFDEALGIPYMHPGGQWFDGYDGQEDVIFDDYSGSEFKLTYLLKLLDRYPMRVPVKGGFVNWVPKRMWITSNYGPDHWYSNAHDEHRRALRRRFTRVVRFRRMSSVVNPGNDDEEEVLVPDV